MSSRSAPLVGILAVACIAPASAHHSFAAVFDAQSPIEVTGTVTRVEWLNPHVWFFIDVESDDGEVVNWAFEMGSPNRLARYGWNHNSLRVGEVITVTGARARDDSFKAAVEKVYLLDGEELFGAQEESR